MIKRILFVPVLCTLFVASIAATNSQAQSLKIGYVDPQAILTKMPEMKAVQQRLQNFYQRKQQELSKKEQDFTDQVTQYQQKASVISDDAKKKEEERLGKLRADLQEYRTKLQQEMQQKQQELVGPLLQQIGDAIDKVAADMGLTYVLNTTTSQNDVIILYASDSAKQKYDITDKVMRQLGI